MILSVSRRTDIPNYYSEWFYNRIKEGFLYVRNPMNIHQISEIKITPDVVDCIVFWTKNPLPMIQRLDEIKDYKYYFQFTLTGYGKDVEANLPNKKTEMIPIFQKLSEKIGKQKVVWRYDPIFFSDRYTKEYHLKAFKSIAKALNGYTEKCVISFADIYPKNKKNMDDLSSYELNDNELREFVRELSNIARDNNIEIGSCAEKIDLDDCGIVHNCCIDRQLIEKIVGCKLNIPKDKYQRPECGCQPEARQADPDRGHQRPACRRCHDRAVGRSGLSGSTETVSDRTFGKISFTFHEIFVLRLDASSIFCYTG